MGKLLERFEGLVDRKSLDLVRKLAAECAGRSVLHVYSGRLRWDVQNMLDRISRVFEDLGLNFRAATMVGTEDFCDVVGLSESAGDQAIPPAAEGLPLFYEAAIRASAERMFLSSDLVVIHGLQPIGLIEHRHDDHPWLWRCHSNVRQARPAFWALAGKYVKKYQAAAFSHASFVPEISMPRYVVPPSVDPFCIGNKDMSAGEIAETLDDVGVPGAAPLVLYFLSQGTVTEALDAVWLWKAARVPEEASLVLVHVGEERTGPAFLDSLDKDVLQAVDRNVHFLRLGRGAARELGALMWAARVVVDPSSSYWPNLALLDAMWKGRPVIVNSCSASATMIQEGGGLCVRSSDEMGGRIRECLEDQEAARSAGAVSRRWVIHRHLVHRHLLDYLKLLVHLKGRSVRA